MDKLGTPKSNEWRYDSTANDKEKILFSNDQVFFCNRKGEIVDTKDIIHFKRMDMQIEPHSDESITPGPTAAEAWLINNPCGHTGFESFVCEICGYPDPRKMIAALNSRVNDLENALIMSNSMLDAISDITEGNEPSEFMMSFGIVRGVWDKIAVFTQQVKELETERRSNALDGQATMDEAYARIKELEKENKILALKNAGTLANNLCPDHRDKQGGKSCLACGIEKVEATNAKYKAFWDDSRLADKQQWEQYDWPRHLKEEL